MNPRRPIGPKLNLHQLRPGRPTREESTALLRVDRSTRRKLPLHFRDLLLSTVIERHVLAVLEACDQNLTLAARLLGMHRRSLQRWRDRPHPTP